MEANLILIGFIVIFIGILILIVGSILSAKTDAKVGFGGFIGPIPFGWANDPQILKIILIVTAIIAVIFFVLVLKGII